MQIVLVTSELAIISCFILINFMLLLTPKIDEEHYPIPSPNYTDNGMQ